MQRFVADAPKRSSATLGIVFGLWLSFASAAAASDARPKVDAVPFREGVMSAMQAALHAPVRTHQDAINAAYFAVGWKWGEVTPETLDDEAFRKARSWGFRIDEFAKTRAARFSSEELSEAPLESERTRRMARAERRNRRRALATRASHPPYPGVLPPSAEERRLTSVTARLDTVQRELNRITAELDALEASALDREARSLLATQLREELSQLAMSLEASQRSVGDIDADVRTMARELGLR